MLFSLWREKLFKGNGIMHKTPITLLFLSVAILGLTSWVVRSGQAGESGATANEYERLLARVADAVVTVKFVSKTSYGYGDEESEEKLYGVMIDASGLVLCSSSEMSSSGWGGQSVPQDIKILIGDNSDGVPAAVIAKDSELDLIWLQIRNSDGKKFNHVDLKNAAIPRLGDRLLSIERKSDFYDRAIVISEDRLGGIFKKPRDLFAPSRGLFSDVGMPVFTADAKLVGFFIQHSPDSGHLESAEHDWDDTEYLILPASSVVKATEQARKSAASASKAGADSKKEAVEEEDED